LGWSDAWWRIERAFGAFCAPLFASGQGGVGDLGTVEEAGAFGTGDGADSHAVDDASDEITDAVWVGELGESGGIGESGDALNLSAFAAFVALFLLAADISLEADLDGEVGQGIDVGFLGEMRDQPAEGLGFGNAEASAFFDGGLGAFDLFEQIVVHVNSSPKAAWAA